MISYNKELYFIDGNHENHSWLIKKTEELIDDNGLVRLDSNIIYVPRGSLVSLEGFNLFCVGGAFSTDRSYRTINKSYWKEEVFVNNQYEEIYNKIKNNNKEIDFFITHDSPGDFNELFDIRYFHNNYSDYLEAVKFRDKLQELYNLSGARINIHGHNHKYNYDEKIGKNMYDIVQAEICLNCDNRLSKEEQFIIFDKVEYDKLKSNKFLDLYDYFLSQKKSDIALK